MSQRGTNRDLDSAQRQAALLLGSGVGPVEVAKRCGVSRATVHRWRQRQDFRAVETAAAARGVAAVEAEVVDAARSRADALRDLHAALPELVALLLARAREERGAAGVRAIVEALALGGLKGAVEPEDEPIEVDISALSDEQVDEEIKRRIGL